MDLSYTWLDVFAEAPLAGNQLAVFQVAADFDERLMQRITRELNHSETTFLQPPTGPDADGRVRIFAPTPTGAVEFPFAGHPLLGSACVAAGMAGGTVRLATGVGVLPVTVARTGPRAWNARMVQPLPAPVWSLPGEAAPRLTLGAVAAALGLGVADLRADLPLEAVNNGMRSVLIPLATADALQRIQPDLSQLRALFGHDGTSVVTFGCPGLAGADVACRVFGPFELVTEDPATGSANGPLAEYLVRHGVVAGAQVTSEQGDFMGRPSRLTMAVERSGATTTAVSVGGRVLQVGNGQFYL